MRKTLVLLALFSLLACLLSTAGLAAAATPNVKYTWTYSGRAIQYDGSMETVTGDLEVLGQNGTLFYGTMTNSKNGNIHSFTGHVSTSGSLTLTMQGFATLISLAPNNIEDGTCSVSVDNGQFTGTGTTSTDLSQFITGLESPDTISVCNGSVSGKIISCVLNSVGGGTGVVTATHK